MIARSAYLLLAGIVVLVGCQNPAENSERIAKKENDKNFDTKSSEKEADFVVETISGNYANVRFSQLAIERSANDRVKEIAAMIEKDHEQLIKELKGFANMRGITIPLEETKNAKKKLDDLARASDKSFDEKWCRELTNRHEKTIEQLEEMWERTTDQELKTWINSALPGMRNNLVKLNSCHEKLTM
jgi:predicted outer membrane protein